MLCLIKKQYKSRGILFTSSVVALFRLKSVQSASHCQCGKLRKYVCVDWSAIFLVHSFVLIKTLDYSNACWKIFFNCFSYWCAFRLRTSADSPIAYSYGVCKTSIERYIIPLTSSATKLLEKRLDLYRISAILTYL